MLVRRALQTGYAIADVGCQEEAVVPRPALKARRRAANCEALYQKGSAPLEIA
jgi:hypothetical protein